MPPPEPPHVAISLNDAKLFINRETSWLAFNERVLEEACDPQVPALERFKFLISAHLLFEPRRIFHVIRVAGLKTQLSGHVEETGPDAMSPSEQLSLVSTRAARIGAGGSTGR